MREKWKILTGLAMAVVILWGSVIPPVVQAGESQTWINNQSFEKKIDTSLWNNPEGDVLSEKNQLVFPAKSTGDTRLITKNTAKVYQEVPVVFDAEFQMNAKAIPKKQEFIFACGLKRIESLPGEDGNVELVFRQKDGAITVGLRTYQNGKKVELKKGQSTGVSQGGSLKVTTRLTAKQNYIVKVNGRTVYDGKLPVEGEGKLGFLQSGNCNIVISQLKITLYSYDTPENPNVKEPFDDETFDCSKITSRQVFTNSYYPFDIGVQDYKGESVLMFENAGLSYLSTKYMYSNFEMTFDVPYLQRKDQVDKNDNVTKPMSGWFAVTYGDEAEYQDGHGFATSADCILFDRYSVVKSLIREKDYIVRAELAKTKYDYFNEDEKRGFSVLVRMVDGHIDLGIKWMNEKKFQIIASYDLDTHSTPTGYIHIWACETANWAMDNLVIKNLDKGAKVMETEYKSAKITVPEDYKFQREEMKYREKEEESNENLWYLMIPGAVVVAAGLILVPLTIKKKKNEKEGENNET